MKIEFCPACRNKISKDVAFCPYCGACFVQSEQQSQQQNQTYGYQPYEYQPPYQNPHGQPPVSQEKKTAPMVLAIIALVLTLASLPFITISMESFWVLVFICEISGIILSAIALKQYGKFPKSPAKPLAIVSLIVSIIPVAIIFFYILFMLTISISML